MGSGAAGHVARRLANVVATLFQVGVTAAASVTIQGVVDEGPRSLVEPALYAFTIWALIFVLSLAYAVYQALSANRDSRLLRRVGWFTAATFFCTGLWSVLVPLRQFGLAQLMLLAIFAFLLLAYLRLSRYARDHSTSKGERWLVALPLGPFLGWVTAPNAASLTAEAVRRGLVDAGGPGEAVFGSVLLFFGALLACAVILAGKAADLWWRTCGRVRDGKRTVRAVGIRRYGLPEVLEALEVPRPCAPAPAAPRDVGSRDLRGAPYVNRSMSWRFSNSVASVGESWARS
jgi:hypothetical protein